MTPISTEPTRPGGPAPRPASIRNLGMSRRSPGVAGPAPRHIALSYGASA